MKLKNIILMISDGHNPAMDMVYCGLREMGYSVIEYPVIDYRHRSDLPLHESGYSTHTIKKYSDILEMCTKNAFDLLITDKFDALADDDVARIIASCDCNFVIIDQTGLNIPCDWNANPYHGRIPDKRYIRTSTQNDAIEKQEVLLISTRRNWEGPTYEACETKYLSMFLGVLHAFNHDVHYRRLLVHDVFEDIPTTFFSRGQKFYNQEYYELLSQSLTGINIKGMVWDCWRFWEILQVGSCLLTEHMANVIEFNPAFIEGEHYFTFKFQFDYESDLPMHVSQELINLLTFAQNNVDEIEKVAKAGHEFALEYHSSVNRARQILKVLA